MSQAIDICLIILLLSVTAYCKPSNGCRCGTGQNGAYCGYEIVAKHSDIPKAGFCTLHTAYTCYGDKRDANEELNCSSKQSRPFCVVTSTVGFRMTECSSTGTLKIYI